MTEILFAVALFMLGVVLVFMAMAIKHLSKEIGEVVKMSNVNPKIVIELIKEISETENTDNNE